MEDEVLSFAPSLRERQDGFAAEMTEKSEDP
jgi:hypothetical protein